jgi:DNA helicase-2/ATP-dependent DNA helicase PcrA
MFEFLGTRLPQIRAPADKQAWNAAMSTLLTLRENGTVGDILDLLHSAGRPRLPDKVANRDIGLQNYTPQTAGEDMPRSLSELKSLRQVQYAEIRALRKYVLGVFPI